MNRTSFRSGSGGGMKCERCDDRPYDIEVDGVALCEECLVKAVRAPAQRKPADVHEIRLLEGEITRLTGRAVRNLKDLPREVVEDLRRAVRNVEQEKSSIKRKLRQYGLPG